MFSCIRQSRCNRIALRVQCSSGPISTPHSPIPSMREIHRTALVPYSVEQMFALVADIERYPQFLPWCADAKVVERNDSEVVASLELAKAGLHERFTTRNTLSPPQT